ncbi:MAG: hypothetical protein GF335_01490 [Candidatus Moranbacteria bacterium]|nr:hypothetical protein [Candidatus Moranbacteria bacterium]
MKKIILFLAILSLSGCGCSVATKIGQKGIYKSNNAGRNFEQKVKYVDEDKNLGSVDVLSIVIDPQDPNKIYVGTKNSGIFKTTNAGEVWDQISQAKNVYSIVLDPRQDNLIYIAGMLENRGKILKSTDAGQSWEEIYLEPAGGSFIPALTIDPFNPEVLYAGSTRGIIYKTQNQGKNWRNIAEIDGPVVKMVLDSGDTRNVYIRVHQKGIYKINYKDNIQVDLTQDQNLSQDKNTWATQVINITPGNSNFNIYSIVSDPNHGDTVYIGTDTGILKSINGGFNWIGLPTLEGANGIPIRAMAITGENSSTIYYAAQGVFYRSYDYGDSWDTMNFSSPYSIEEIAVSPVDKEVIYLGLRQFEQQQGGFLPFQ